MIVEARKRCSGCDSEKPLSDFYKAARYSDGHQRWCKACSLKAVKRYQRRVGKSVIHRSVKYGLSPACVLAHIQIPVCQSCGRSFTDSHSQKFDHCHAGGHFRGVLCHACNLACAGTSAEVIPRLQSCIEYLRRDLERVREQG